MSMGKTRQRTGNEPELTVTETLMGYTKQFEKYLNLIKRHIVNGRIECGWLWIGGRIIPKTSFVAFSIIKI